MEGGGAEKVLLLQSQLLPLHFLRPTRGESESGVCMHRMTSESHVVIWVEDASDVLSQVAIKHGPYVVPVIDWKWGEKRERCVSVRSRTTTESSKH